MSDYNSIRSRIIRIIFGGSFLIIIAQLFNLQLLSRKYSQMADDQAMYRKVIYPSRGLVYDRNGRVILDNTTLYDLVVIPSQLKGVDTNAICNIVGIDTAEFKQRVINAIIKNGRYQPSVFQGLLDPSMYAKLNENLYKIQPGFDLIERPVRKYPYDAAGPVLGYLGEVDTGYLRRHPEGGYVRGDYFGVAGIERTYEKALMGQRGIEYWLRDNKNRPTQRFENGESDTMAVAGSNLYSSIDIELQELGERLLKNKIGSVVAIDPQTGGILAMVSGPGYKPSLLTGSGRTKHINEMYNDPRLPLLNRAVSATYSPGSTFKTLNALIGLQEGVITTSTSFYCPGGYFGCGKKMGCLDPGTFSLKGAITHSCNGYFGNVLERIINNKAYPTIDSSLAVWANYMNAFGLGHKLGVDVPSEKPGLIPTPAYYNKVYGAGKWQFCTFKSNSIGQGEVNTTPLQVANEMAYIANKGWYIIPHVIDSISGGDKYGLLEQFKQKHTSVTINDSVFEAVHDGMQGVMESGTGRAAKIEGIVVCGKTGTVENFYRGVQQKDHSFFAAFAPRKNPKIAIMCVVENAGYGATYAAPIVSLMIEKYIKGKITDKGRLAKIEQLEKTTLIPAKIYLEYKRQDSIRHIKDTGYLIQKGYLKMIKDTMGLEETPEVEIKSEKDSLKKVTPPVKKKPVSSANKHKTAMLNINNSRKKTYKVFII